MTTMNVHEIPQLLSMTAFPVGFGGCRNDGHSFDCCEYNVTVFDGKEGESIHDVAGQIVKVHHCSLEESNMGVLTQLSNLTPLHDDEWKLKMFLSKIKEKKDQILKSYGRNCLVDSEILANKAKESVRSNDPFAAIWIKCSAYFFSDALFALNSKRPSPTHMLDITRNLRKNEINQKFSTVHRILGIERASTSILSRMVKSTIGFSDMVENNGNSRIIKRKYDYLVENSLLADCYFYLGYVNRNNIMKIKNRIHKNPEYIHVLKVALDIEGDPLLTEKQATELLQGTKTLLSDIKDQQQ